jgi:tRNA(Ile)-lysidine synthase
MTEFSSAALHDRLRALLPPQTRRLCVAFSGGLDSTVLLCALAELRHAFTIRAIHVDHQLQAASAAWAEHCQRVATRIGVPLTCLRVMVSSVAEEGVEAGARRARYDALRAELAEQEALLTAHHADDQLETMLLALARGAGVRGLSAIPAIREFGHGCLVRPLLPFPREALVRWARARSLDWIDDPMNTRAELDRNYLRHRVLPALNERWPSIATTTVRSAAHLAEASRLLDELAAADFANLSLDEGRGLDAASWAALNSARRRNVLRYWLRTQGVERAPSARKLASLEHDILTAERDRQLAIDIDGWEIRRHRAVLYCLTPLGQIPERELDLAVASNCCLPIGWGTLELVPPEGGAANALALDRLPERLAVKFRVGGERIKVAHNRPHRALKKVLQDVGVLPWWRERLPLVYANDRLIAVGDLWVDPELAPGAHERAATIVWRGKPNIMAIR